MMNEDTGNVLKAEGVLRQCQLVQLRLLHAIDRVCKEHGLTYVLESGTLLGAIRHDGFIPWDDDLDVGMPRKDYNTFLRIAQQELPENVMLCEPTLANRTAIPFAKVRDKNSFYCECRPDIATSDPSGIYVDIFPYDKVPNIGLPLQRLLCRVCASTWKRSRLYYNKGGCFGPLVGIYVCLAMFCQLSSACVHAMIWLLSCLAGSKHYVLCLQEGCGFVYRKDDLFPATTHRFEDGVFPVPANAERILAAQYGDWRQIPPPDKRPRHARIIDPFHAAIAPWAMAYPGVVNT